ncbi:phage holin family protein [Rubritalea marina]|uniref:phage holin family protein n=1 Tax=Rubritalea marina TaxID=361055 RepID=UPI0003749541|nr:phage holin family protein [Rubritalea marina]
MPDSEVTEDTPVKFSLKELIQFLKESSGNYLSAKSELASIEAKEAAEIMAHRVGLFIKLAFIGFFTYALFIAGLIGVVTKLLEGKLANVEQYVGTWPVAVFLVLLVHLLGLFILLDKVKSSQKKELFKYSKEELEKDKLWIQQMASKEEN